ncbi:hypothetical protein [Luteococcus japonicus]|uniref:hypothetical protein n=1 Tax=Luteococcus japonicus TaxID=33984 RepID=UPI0011CE9A32|nr:hypothetical protein [Luteococcus japonicus]
MDAADKEVDAVYKFWYDHDDALDPGDIHEDYRFTDLVRAMGRVELLATADVAQAARALTSATQALFVGKKNPDEWEHERDRFLVAANHMLSSPDGVLASDQPKAIESAAAAQDRQRT